MSERKITVIENFLDEDVYNRLVDYSIRIYKSPVKNTLKSNYSWEDSIVLDSFPVLIHCISADDYLYQEIYTEVYKKLNVFPSSMMVYYWTRMSHIPWHYDNHVDSALTIYLNKGWNKNWGGAFMFNNGSLDIDDDTDIRALYPTTNRGVYQEGGVMHTVNPTTSSADVRVTLQVFFNKEAK